MEILGATKYHGDGTEISRKEEKGFYNERSKVHFGPTEYIEISFTDFYKNDFASLELLCEDKVFETIVEGGRFKTSHNLISHYVGSFKNPLYFCICNSNLKNEYLIVVSFDEVQPMIFALYLEGVWSISCAD
jgi:hypothetical protein